MKINNFEIKTMCDDGRQRTNYNHRSRKMQAWKHGNGNMPCD